MPHRRAKRSVREQNRLKEGQDWAPSKESKSLESEAIPKSVARVLNASKTQTEWREKKRKETEDDGRAKKKAKIVSNESVPDRKTGRYEPTRSAIEKLKLKSEPLKEPYATRKPSSMKQARQSSSPEPEHEADWKDFEAATTSAPRRLNDIVQAPPDISVKLKKAKADSTTVEKNGAVVSMSQKARMEEERERAIKRYRELKERKLQERR